MYAGRTVVPLASADCNMHLDSSWLPMGPFTIDFVSRYPSCTAATAQNKIYNIQPHVTLMILSHLLRSALDAVMVQ